MGDLSCELMRDERRSLDNYLFVGERRGLTLDGKTFREKIVWDALTSVFLPTSRTQREADSRQRIIGRESSSTYSEPQFWTGAWSTRTKRSPPLSVRSAAFACSAAGSSSQFGSTTPQRFTGVSLPAPTRGQYHSLTISFCGRRPEQGRHAHPVPERQSAHGESSRRR